MKNKNSKSKLGFFIGLITGIIMFELMNYFLF